jgi:ferredoxin
LTKVAGWPEGRPRLLVTITTRARNCSRIAVCT